MMRNDLLVNPFGSGYAAGNVELRAMQTVDIAVRHPEIPKIIP
jgi:hypothetical protein